MKTAENPQNWRQLSSIPAVVRSELDGKELQLFRVHQEGVETYQLEAGEEVLCVFQPWQFYALGALYSFGGDSYTTLLENVNARFSLALSQADIDTMFAELQAKQLFDDNNAVGHPLTKTFAGQGIQTAMPSVPLVATNNNEKDDGKQKEKGAKGFKFKMKITGPIHLWNPTGFFRRYRDVLESGKYAFYPLPFFLFASLFILLRHGEIVQQDTSALLMSFNIVTHLLFGFVAVNSLEVFVTAAFAYMFGATVPSISAVLLFGFIPRFKATIEDTEKFTRREKLWTHSALLLTSLWLFSFGVFFWYHGRPLNNFVSGFGSTLAWISGISFMISACPFYKSNGYQLLTEFLGEPNLREKAYKEVLNKWHKKSYAMEYSVALIAYAVVCAVFMLAFFLVSFFLIYNWLDEQIGANSVLVLSVGVAYGSYRLWKEMVKINEQYEQNVKLERWRERALLHDVTDMQAAPAAKKTINLKRGAIIAAILILPMPYPYQPSGQVVLMPITQQQISTDVTGIIDEVYFDGGEVLPKGTLIARLSVSDYQAQLAIQKANLVAQEAVVNKLKLAPTQEQIDVAREHLGVAKLQAQYSDEKCVRQQKLYKSGAISLDSMADVEKVCAVDKQEVIQAEAELARVVAGTPPEDIAAAQAALLPIQAQIKLYEDQIARSEFRMPFTGKLATLYLKEMQGHYLERGAPLAVAQDDSVFKAALEVPETDLEHVHEGNTVEVKTMAYPDAPFKGVVKIINSEIVEQPYGRMVKMVVNVEKGANGEALKSGMTGYAKVNGDYVSVWHVLTSAIYRFVTIEIWAWIP